MVETASCQPAVTNRAEEPGFTPMDSSLHDATSRKREVLQHGVDEFARNSGSARERRVRADPDFVQWEERGEPPLYAS